MQFFLRGVLFAIFPILPAAAAETGVSVEQLLEKVIDGIETGVAEAELARNIDRISLTQSLSDQEIKWLTRVGTGPATSKALGRLQTRSALQPRPVQPIIDDELRPTPDETDQILGKATKYASNYTSTLVDFTCTAVTETLTKSKSEGRLLPRTSLFIPEPSAWQKGRKVTQKIATIAARNIIRISDRPKRITVTASHPVSPGLRVNLRIC